MQGNEANLHIKNMTINIKGKKTCTVRKWETSALLFDIFLIILKNFSARARAGLKEESWRRGKSTSQKNPQNTYILLLRTKDPEYLTFKQKIQILKISCCI